jgi:amino acid efflux transporter
MALLSCVLAAGLLVLAGWHLVFPAGVAIIALAVGVLARRHPRPDRRPDPGEAASAAPDPG